MTSVAELFRGYLVTHRVEHVGAEIVPSYLPVRRLLNVARRFGWDALRFVEPMPDDLLFTADQASEVRLTPDKLDGPNESIGLRHSYKRIQPRLLKGKRENCTPVQVLNGYAAGGMTDHEAARFGAAVKEARQAHITNGRRLSQWGLARLLAAKLKEEKVNGAPPPTQQTISHIEKGKTKDSKYSIYVAEILGMAIDKLPTDLSRALSNRKRLFGSVQSSAGEGAQGALLSVAGRMDKQDLLILEGLIREYRRRKLGGGNFIARVALEIDARLEDEGTNP